MFKKGWSKVKSNVKENVGLYRGLTVLLIFFALAMGVVLLNRQFRKDATTPIVETQVISKRAFSFRESTLQMDVGLFFSGEAVNLNLFDDEKFAIKMVRSDTPVGSGFSSYKGFFLDGAENREADFVEKAGIVYGSIRTPNHVIEVRPLGKGMVRVSEKSWKSFPPEEPEVHLQLFPLAASVQDKVASAKLASSAYEIDVAVFYTPDVVEALGSVENANAKAALSVAIANQTFQNSSIQGSLRLVYTGLTNYPEGADFDWYKSLGRLMTKNDGYMDDVIGVRERLGVDVVTLLVTDSSYCGLSNVLSSNMSSANFEPYALNLVNENCSTDYLSFSHELSHLLGSGHDPMVGCFGYAKYSCGWVSQNKLYRTVESYPNSCNGCPKRNVFSSKDVLYLGQPIGDNGSDNGRTFWSTVAIVGGIKISNLNHMVYLPFIAR